MCSKHNPESWDSQRNPFGEDFYLPPREDETLARAKQVLQDNRDAIRHYVELLIWETKLGETKGDSDTLKILIPLLWHWEDIAPEWMAEACYMSVSDVCDLAESQPLLSFPCLDCGVELHAKNKGHLVQMHRSLQTLCEVGFEAHCLMDLICGICVKQRKEHAAAQRRFDQLRQEAILKEYRQKPYEERRQSREWAILKKQVHRRDRYRCRLCGRNDVELHVHHCTYLNYASEKLEDLITLCSNCHQKAHFREAS